MSSFGAESVVLLHMVSVTRRDTPVIFIDTELLFAETLVYQQEVSERLGLTDVRVDARADARSRARRPDGTLHRHDTDACCALRKTVPLAARAAGFDGWITGRKRFRRRARRARFLRGRGGHRAHEGQPARPLAPEDMQTYMEENRLPRHPLVARGYPSIGCMPCTSPVAKDEDPAQAAGAARKKPNAASISSMAGDARKE